jgi:DNA helicase-2/ATP-dependent DNA helicase PcrA
VDRGRAEGEKVRLIGHWDGEEEARWIGEEIEAIQRGTRGRDPTGLNGQVILVRASHQMRAFEDRFLTIGLPYRVIGGPRFYERAEIRDAMAYFRLAVSPDDDLAFERVVNLPKRGLGDKAVQMIQTEARSVGMSLLEGARSLLARGGSGRQGGGAAARLRRGGGPLACGDRHHPARIAEAVIEPLLPDTPALLTCRMSDWPR